MVPTTWLRTRVRIDSADRPADQVAQQVLGALPEWSKAQRYRGETLGGGTYLLARPVTNTQGLEAPERLTKLATEDLQAAATAARVQVGDWAPGGVTCDATVTILQTDRFLGIPRDSFFDQGRLAERGSLSQGLPDGTPLTQTDVDAAIDAGVERMAADPSFDIYAWADQLAAYKTRGEVRTAIRALQDDGRDSKVMVNRSLATAAHRVVTAETAETAPSRSFVPVRLTRRQVAVVALVATLGGAGGAAGSAGIAELRQYFDRDDATATTTVEKDGAGQRPAAAPAAVVAERGPAALPGAGDTTAVSLSPARRPAGAGQPALPPSR